ncbi:MAG: XkdF-like putative serine protease domain-containing protein [Myxococcota bacterium]
MEQESTGSPRHARRAWTRQVAIRKRDTGRRLVLGEVYVPYDPNDSTTVDSHGHATTAREIEQAAHDFLAASRQECVDVQHDGLSGYGRVVESYLAKQGDPLFKPGAWVVGIRVTDDDAWAAIEREQITGISLAGEAELVPTSSDPRLDPREQGS